MKTRTFAQTILKSARRLLTTPPNTWYWQWRMANSPVPIVPVPNTRSDYLELKAQYSPGALLVGEIQMMQDWERPLMRALAKEAARSGGHVLEVGFGMGISADYLIEAGCSRYTVIEPHPGVLEHFREWAPRQAVPVDAIQGFWEDTIDDLPVFDGILFDTFPVSADETGRKVYLPFLAKASEHLRPGGVFTFYSGYPDALPAKDIELLKAHFTKVELHRLTGLRPPPDCQYYRETKMVVPVCIR